MVLAILKPVFTLRSFRDDKLIEKYPYLLFLLHTILYADVNIHYSLARLIPLQSVASSSKFPLKPKRNRFPSLLKSTPTGTPPPP